MALLNIPSFLHSFIPYIKRIRDVYQKECMTWHREAGFAAVFGFDDCTKFITTMRNVLHGWL